MTQLLLVGLSYHRIKYPETSGLTRQLGADVKVQVLLLLSPTPAQHLTEKH